MESDTMTGTTPFEDTDAQSSGNGYIEAPYDDDAPPAERLVLICKDCQERWTFDNTKRDFDEMERTAAGHVSEDYRSPCGSTRRKAVWEDGTEAAI